MKCILVRFRWPGIYLRYTSLLNRQLIILIFDMVVILVTLLPPLLEELDSFFIYYYMPYSVSIYFSFTLSVSLSIGVILRHNTLGVFLGIKRC